ncbi:gp53-like domain-containing protein [Pantoea septica]|uniref:gp53-like domain-containing protein n=1 Tax=Pantoea septica TaxID=472695 RepID=UPI0028994C54|nr:hypothetical protein [Pantoea septica]
MATNNFKSFAIGAGANVMSQADYEALEALATGFKAGKASSSQVNKALRQSSSMAAMIGQFLNAANVDALDNGNIATLLANFTSALTTNLSLGTVSKRNVGTSANQVPDMSSFSSSLATNGYQKFPGGLIFQWGRTNNISVPGSVTATFPTAFPNATLAVWTSENSNSSPAICAWGIGAITTTTVLLYGIAIGSAVSSEQANFFAIGY